MLSQIPINLDKIRKEDLDKEILRAALIAELDAVNLYEQMAASVENRHIKTILSYIVREERLHVVQCQALMNRLQLPETIDLQGRGSEQDGMECTHSTR